MKNKFALKKGILLGIGLAALIGGTILGWPSLMKLFSSPGKKINSKYAGNLYMLEHDYVYAVTFDIEGSKNTIFMVKGESNQFDVWKPGQNANKLYATALMIDSSGACITSSYAVTPWNNRFDYHLLMNLLRREFDIPEDQITISGYSLKMALRKFDLPADETTKINCKPICYTGLDADDLVDFIQTTSDIKSNSFQQVKFPESINGDKEKLYLLGTVDQNNQSPSKVTVTLLDKDEVTNTRYFLFKDAGKWFSEGAPIFNRKGELVGVYSGYNSRADGPNNIMSSPIRKSTDLASFIREHGQIEADESFVFLNQENPVTNKVTVAKEWKTIIELRAPSLNPYDPHVFYGINGGNGWFTPDFKINMKNTRLCINIDKLVKDEEYRSDLNVTILEKNEQGEKKEETVSLRYDKEGTFIENLWKFDGIYEIYVEGMSDCEFKIELQTEE